MRNFIILSSFLFFQVQTANALTFEQGCVSELTTPQASEVAALFLHMQHDLASVEMTGIPSVGSIERCQLASNESLYVIKGRLHAGCFLGNIFTLYVKESTPKFPGDRFSYEMEFLESEIE